MAQNDHEARLIRFGAFELDVEGGELRKHGIRLRLADQPFRILLHLLQHPGKVVTREELRTLLWGEDTFVDFDHGLNAAINKIRETLGDSAASPRYIETVPRRGYRFIADLALPPIPRPEEVSAPPAQEPAPSSPAQLPVTPRARRHWRWAAGVAVIVLLAFGVGAWWGIDRSTASVPQYNLRPLTDDAGLTTIPAVSPDGKLVAYASD